MRIQDVMTTKLVSITPDSDVGRARQSLDTNGIHHLVVMEKHRLIGILSDRDLAGVASDTTVRNVMTKEVATIAPGATLRQAAAVMDGHRVHCLPVAREGEVVGIITSSDLLRALAKGDLHLEPPSERYTMRGRGPRRRPPTA